MLKASIETLQDNAHQNAIAKGFWDGVQINARGQRVMTNSELAEKLCLIHSEVSEALEDLRDGKMETQFLETSGDQKGDVLDFDQAVCRGDSLRFMKPIGFPSELADIAIRLFDLCGALNIDLQHEIELKMAHNATRPAKHGKAF